MKKITLLFLLFVGVASAQTFEFGLVYTGDYSTTHTFDIVARPDFSYTGVDASDAGITINADDGNGITMNAVGLTGVEGSPWSGLDFDAATIFGATGVSGYATSQFTRDPGSTTYNAVAGVPQVMCQFAVTSTPTSGTIEIGENGVHPVLVALGGAFDNFYNANIGAGTVDLYGGRIAGQELFNFGTLSAQDNELTGISMYPNPANNEFAVRGLDMESNITIHDMNGKLVMTRDAYTGDAINVAQLQAGVYFVNIANDNGSATKKLIVE